MSRLINIVVLSVGLYFAWKKSSVQTPVLLADKLDATYDYVIVGAGSAGSVIAGRLSEDADVTVAVLEAGDDDAKYPDSKVPMMWINLQKTEADWAYKTVPQKHACKGLEENRSAWPRGKLMGGSGQINGLWYIRGNRHDYDRWENEFGAEGWSYANVLPYFKKSEFANDDNLAKSGYHGTEGNWKVTVSNVLPELTDLYLTASEELGQKRLPEINGKIQEGFSPMSSFKEKGVRSTTYNAFVESALATRENLDVLAKAHVTRILFTGKRATGVEYLRDGRLLKVNARKEVILSAGAIGSPHILMLSGIGRKENLEKFGIHVLADLPVGENLQDHIMNYPFNYEIEQPVSVTMAKAESLVETTKYNQLGEGCLGTSMFEGVGFYRSEHQPTDDPRPFMQSALAGTLFGNEPKLSETFKGFMNFKQEAWDHFAYGQKYKHGFSILVGLQRPTSKGTIKLASGNPFHHPLIDPRYLEEEIDVEHMLHGIRFQQKYTNTKAFRNFGAKVIERRHPLCSNEAYDSDDYWRCVIRTDTLTIYHPTSTCKMGRKEDNTTVVDSQLRVHGIDGLRVADASIMPEITTGNTMVPTVMIGEKAADLIKGKKLPPITNL